MHVAFKELTGALQYDFPILFFHKGVAIFGERPKLPIDFQT